MPDPWFVEAFRQAYLDVYAHRDESAARDEVAFAGRMLGARAGVRILDAGCGAGRHARALAATGARVVAMDLSADLLRVAERAGGGPAYVRGDLRALPFRTGAFEAVASFFTAFGYFDDAANLSQLREFARVLVPGGRLVLDYLNAAHVEQHLVPESERMQGDRRVLERRRIRDGRVEKDVRVEQPGHDAATWTESVRLYREPDLRQLVGEAFLRVVSVHGDLAGAPFEASSSRRCVVVAEAA